MPCCGAGGQQCDPDLRGQCRVSATNRWTVAVAAVIMQSGFGSLYAWSVFRQPLSAHYDTNITAVNVAFFVASLVFGVSTFGAGFLLRRTANAIEKALEPRGILVVIEAEHLCMSMRGVQKPGSQTVTSSVTGIFRENEATRAEAMNFISRG